MNNMNGKHAELKVQWVQDQRDNWTQVWQYKTKYQDECTIKHLVSNPYGTKTPSTAGNQ